MSLSVWRALLAPRLRVSNQASYLKESATRVRNAVTFPPSTFMSILTTSATRRSRIELAAISTARRPVPKTCCSRRQRQRSGRHSAAASP